MGGATETVIPPPDPRPTGLLYPQQDVASIRAAVEDFARDPGRFRPENCRRNAERFSAQRFREQFGDFVDSAWHAFEKAKR